MKHRDTEAPSKTYYDSDLTGLIIQCAMEVHRTLGPGLLESIYEECLCHELRSFNIAFTRQMDIPIRYKGHNLKGGHRLDLVIADKVIVELKCVEKIIAVHEAQLLTYLRLSGIKTGLIINFFTPVLKDGIRRLVY